jgi:hypothetical protein
MMGKTLSTPLTGKAPVFGHGFALAYGPLPNRPLHLNTVQGRVTFGPNSLGRSAPKPLSRILSGYSGHQICIGAASAPFAFWGDVPCYNTI